LLRCLNGLVVPSAGHVPVGDPTVTGATPQTLRRIRAESVSSSNSSTCCCAGSTARTRNSFRSTLYRFEANIRAAAILGFV
jgi:hypothetical protein